MDHSVTEVEPAPLAADVVVHRPVPQEVPVDLIVDTISAPDDATPVEAARDEVAPEEAAPKSVILPFETAATVAPADLPPVEAEASVAAPNGVYEAPAETEAGGLAPEMANAPAADEEVAVVVATDLPVSGTSEELPAQERSGVELDASSGVSAKPAVAKAAVAKPAPRTRPEAANDAAPGAAADAPSPPVPERAAPPMRHEQRGSHMMNGRPPAISRASLLDETFSEGDHVVYPTHGVGRVEKIAVEEIAGQKLELIQITFEENRMTLRVPVTKARSAGLRRLATRKLFDEALALLKGRARVKKTMWSRRAQEYEAKINSGDPLQIAEVVRDLHRNSGQPDQSFSERQIYEAALDRLAAELAALDETDKATASTKLTNFLKTIA